MLLRAPLSMFRLMALIALTMVLAASREAAAQVPSEIPGEAGQLMLIRNTIAAVNHGVITGNYTVVRDLGSPKFRERNTAADLAVTFGELSRQNFDLSPTLITQPQLTQFAAVDPHGRLNLMGYFATQPQAVRFSIYFVPVDGGWMIDEVALGIVPAATLVN